MFAELLAQLAAEHEREVRALRDDIAKLRAGAAARSPWDAKGDAAGVDVVGPRRTSSESKEVASLWARTSKDAAAGPDAVRLDVGPPKQDSGSSLGLAAQASSASCPLAPAGLLPGSVPHSPFVRSCKDLCPPAVDAPTSPPEASGWLRVRVHRGIDFPAPPGSAGVVLSLRVGGKVETVAAAGGGASPVWDSPELEFPVAAADADLDLAVWTDDGVSPEFGGAALAFRSLQPQKWHAMREQLKLGEATAAQPPGCRSHLELEVRWEPAGSDSPRRPTQSVRRFSHNATNVDLSALARGKSGAMSVLLLNQKIRALEMDDMSRQMERFAKMFQLNAYSKSQRTAEPGESRAMSVAERRNITADDLQRVLSHRGLDFANFRRLQDIVDELARVAHEALAATGLDTPPMKRASNELPLATFVDLVTQQDLLSAVGEEFVEDVQQISKALLAQDIDEVICNVTRVSRDPQAALESRKKLQKERLLFRLSLVVSITILLSVLALGISMDVRPESPGWIVLESLFCMVFLAEFVMKIWLMGAREFFCGLHRWGHALDLTITSVAIVDVVLSIVWAVIDPRMAHSFKAARISLVLRSLRLARVARLVKLFNGPFLKDLATMLSGLFLGMPTLMWVTILLGFVTYILALMLRSVVGPEPGSNLISRCGTGDLQQQSPHLDGKLLLQDECPICELYAEEFLGNMIDSMSVVFRCIVGDCTSRGGQSLAGHFSACFSWQFEIVYFFGMVAIIFGVFNIITAIFVQATMDGLQTSHVQSKYAQMYESKYMRRKLEALVRRINEICDEVGGAELPAARYMGGTGDIMLTEDLFYAVIQDRTVDALLKDLDVKIDHRINSFSMFDINNDGRVSVIELVQTMMKMRGEPQKSDLVASWALLEDVRSQLHEFQMASLANQKNLLKVLHGRPSITLEPQSIPKPSVIEY